MALEDNSIRWKDGFGVLYVQNLIKQAISLSTNQT
jgi:hypothetical protein